jgi:azurin/glucose/arabinose dehydrogenase
MVRGLAVVPAQAASPENTILFYGNSLVERLMEEGSLEAMLQLANPTADLAVRSLAWTGDEVGYRLRPEGYAEHMKTLLAKWPAKTIVVGFGNNESFGGSAGLKQFKKDWAVYLREIRRLHPGARLVLLSPVAAKSGGDLDLFERNKEVESYAAAVAGIARDNGALFVDLFTATREFRNGAGQVPSLQGIALGPAEIRKVARLIARALLGNTTADGFDPGRVEEVARAVALKAEYVSEVVRPKNGVVYYGVRKRAEENAAEIPRYHEMIEQSDALIHSLVKHPETKLSDYPRPALPPLPEGKSVPDRFSGGIMKSPLEQQKDITVADGYALNLFASEAEFPELKAPVQIAFDARGRLWVVTMPSFPHTVPGLVPDDKILILEDLDHDGKADKCTVFADGFDALDGVAFHERGVIVSAQPRLLLLRDLDGDGRADTREELIRGVDVTDSHHGGMIATDPLGHVIFSDGVFHRSQFETPFGVVRGIDSTTYRLDLGSGRINTEWQGMTPNPWKTSFDRYGNIFQRFGGGHVLDGLPQTWTPLGVYHAYGNGTVVNYGKGSALSVVSSPNFPDKYQQGVVSAALLGSYCVSISAPDAAGGAIVGTERLDLLTSQNSAFRPVDTAFGMDGALYVSDFASRIIGHAQHPMRDPQWNHTLGRIWRVVAKDRPVVKDWPQIEGATAVELVKLLSHPQDVVREHVRIELRRLGTAALPVVDSWISSLDSVSSEYEQVLLEGIRLMQAQGQMRPAWIRALLGSKEPRMRAAAVQVLRFEADKNPETMALLGEAARDPHPRVRMALVNVVSHLRAASALRAAPGGAVPGHATHAATRDAVRLEGLLEGMNAHEPAVQQMMLDLKAGTRPAKGRSVPVLEVSPATEVLQWLVVPSPGAGSAGAGNSATLPDKAKATIPKAFVYRTFLETETAQSALLSVKHGYVDVLLNGVQLLSSDSPYSSQQQIHLELRQGLNLVELVFRKLKNAEARPSVFVCDMLGEELVGTRAARNAAELGELSARWDAAHADDANALKIQAVPNLLQFSPKEIRVKAGQEVRLIFENPDLMQHNLVLVDVGAEEEVGGMADQMAARSDAFAKNFVPESAKVLSATPLVNPNGRAELQFTAPLKPGAYPFICTFPGHWRVMRGVMFVE